MKYGSEKRSHLCISVWCLTASTGNKHFQVANIPHPWLSRSHTSMVYRKTWSNWPIDWPTMSIPVIMAIASSRAGRVLAWSHLHRPNLHMYILNYNSRNTSCVTLEMLPKASLYLDLRYVQQFRFNQWPFLLRSQRRDMSPTAGQHELSSCDMYMSLSLNVESP